MSDLSPVDLRGEITDRLSEINPGKIMILTYVDSAGEPHVSVRASIHAHGPDQLGLWVRDGYVGTMTPGAKVGALSMTPTETPRPGGFLEAIAKNPHVAILYREGRTTFVFSGRARVEEDPAERDVIFAAIPVGEQNHSTATGQRTGAAVIVDVDHVVGGSLGDGGVIASHVEMARA